MKNLNFLIRHTTRCIISLLILFTCISCSKEEQVAPQLNPHIYTFLEKYFSGLEITQIEKDNLGYSLITLVDKSKILFSPENEWKKISCKLIPSEIFPQEIIDYLKTKYPDAKSKVAEKEENKLNIYLDSGDKVVFSTVGIIIVPWTNVEIDIIL